MILFLKAFNTNWIHLLDLPTTNITFLLITKAFKVLFSCFPATFWKFGFVLHFVAFLSTSNSVHWIVLLTNCSLRLIFCTFKATNQSRLPLIAAFSTISTLRPKPAALNASTQRQIHYIKFMEVKNLVKNLKLVICSVKLVRFSSAEETEQ